MAKLQIKIEGELHRVVYIDYNDGIPHQVMTTHFVEKADKPYWRLYWWDFFGNNGDKEDLYAYESGSGGSHNKIQAPQWSKESPGKYWLADDAKFTGNPQNATRLKNPLLVKTCFGNSINPFKVAQITDTKEYCEECGNESLEFCHKHKYEDNEGNDRWKKDDSLC